MQIFSPKKTKTTTTTTPPPAVTDTTRQSQDAVDELLRRRGLSSNIKTATVANELTAVPSSKATLLGG